MTPTLMEVNECKCGGFKLKTDNECNYCLNKKIENLEYDLKNDGKSEKDN